MVTKNELLTNEQEYISVQTAAKIMDVTDNTIRNWLGREDYHLIEFKVGRVKRISRKSFYDFIDRKSKEGSVKIDY